MAQVLADEEKAQREPVVKKQFIIVLSDPRGTVPDEDYVGWVVQIPEDDNPGTAIERIKRAPMSTISRKRAASIRSRALAKRAKPLEPSFKRAKRIDQDEAPRYHFENRQRAPENRGKRIA